jgi:chloramphenicol-sensitive protein RarD
MQSSTKQGVILAISAYTMWGLAPVYFKLLEHIPSVEILVHRIVWSTLLLGIIITLRAKWDTVKQVIRTPKTMLILLMTSSFLAFNWWLFIWSVNNNHMLDASLGYYINPLLNVALGMIFLSERLTRLQAVAVAMAVIGVVIQVIGFGSFPVIAFSLAISFAIYGLIRKTVAVDSLTGLLIESFILLVPAVIYWWMFADSSAVNMLNNSLQLNLLLVAAGLVTTAPLLCFLAAARRLNYSTMGFFQYIGPSFMFLFAVFVYGEQFGADRWVTFGFIWAALVVYSYASYRKYRSTRALNVHN